jgi:hypothetical protein
MSIALRKELLIPVLWNIPGGNIIGHDPGLLFQIHEEKIWRGRRIFRMSPLHHHFQNWNA